MNKSITLISSFFLIISVSCNPEGYKTGRESRLSFNGPYSGDYLNHTAFPIGGIGAGMICLEGIGAISHVSVFNKPDVFNEPAMFAAISVKGMENGAKVLEGPVPDRKIFGRPSTARGAPRTTYGLPRFKYAEFVARIPFGTVRLQDDEIPLEVSLTAWSPFIPQDADNSSLPLGAIEYTFKNPTNSDIEAVFSYNTVNFMRQPGGRNTIKSYPNGFILSNLAEDENQHMQGDFAIFTTEKTNLIDHCWFRGAWFDPLTISWKHIAEGNPRVTDPVDENAPGASLFIPFVLKPHETKTIKLLMAWYVPNTDLRRGREVISPEIQGDPAEEYCENPYHRPWYSSRFNNINEVADYWLINYNELRSSSELFTEAFYNTTLPDEVVEAVAANLTTLKSPTVLRQYDGRLWAFEGCNDDSGCCAGSCNHVWNYAQAIPHLFSSLERSLRETESFVSQNEEGHQVIRSALPIREADHSYHSAADGQLGGVMKVFRDWRISGDNEWLEKIYPYVKTSLNYSIRTWDPRERGTLEEPHHNTYDVEFWGPNGMGTSFYLGALKAFIIMGEFLGDDVKYYQSLLDKGIETMENDLFDGEYFYQKTQVDGLNAPSPVEASKLSLRTWYSDEAVELLHKEGPKYQYGTGCLSDGILGMWMAKVCGIEEEIVNSEKLKSHLKSVYRYNFKTDLSNHANPQRPTFAMNHEAGLLLCTWPKGDALSLPFIYSNEVWTGIEYQVASHLMFFGEKDDALDIVRAVRTRYDGRVRNPFNEFECGHWYARAMSSYAMLQALTGIRYDAVTKTLYIDSRVGDNFDSFFSCQTGFGNIGLKNGKPYVKMTMGSMDIEKCIVSGINFPIQQIINL